MVHKNFGFNIIFCNGITTIFHSARLYVLVNDNATSFFVCSRGVKQWGLPLSLFCIAEDALSRKLVNLVEQRYITCITHGRTTIESHTFFVDDIMIFCKDTKKWIWYPRVITRICSKFRQRHSPIKCKMFEGAISSIRLR